MRPTCKCTPAPVTATVGCASEPTRAQHQQSDSLKDSHPLSWSPCDHTLQHKSRTRVFPSPRKFQLHTCPLMTSEMASATAQRRENKLATLRVHHLEIMTQPALGGAQCCGEQRGAKPPFTSRSAFLERFVAKRRGLLGTSQEKPPQCPRPQRHNPDETAGTACSLWSHPVSRVPSSHTGAKSYLYDVRDKRSTTAGAGRRRAGSPVWEWINDHWHASAPHLAPIHPPLRATHPSRAMDRKTVF